MDLKNKTTQLEKLGQKSIFVLLFFHFSIYIVACHGKREIDKNSKANVVLEYAVMDIVPRPTTLFSDFPTTIEGQQNVEIRPKIDGYVEMIYVDEGSIVKKGQQLFRINAPQYEQEVRSARADILIAEADVNEAQMEVDKVKPLVEKNIISKYELESVQFALQSRQAVLAQAHAKLANAQTNLNYTTIASPVNGVIGTIPYKIGSLISSNTTQPLTTVSNIGNVYAYFSINEKQLLQFSKDTKGATFKDGIATLPPVSLVLANGSEFLAKGKIDAASGMINTQTGSLKVRATFPNVGSIIRSGSSGTVRIPQLVNAALLIPQKVTYEIQGKKFVFVLDSTGIVRATEISVLDADNGQYFVIEKGLKAGDRVVMEGVSTLREGVSIKAKVVNVDSLYKQMTL